MPELPFPAFDRDLARLRDNLTVSRMELDLFDATDRLRELAKKDLDSSPRWRVWRRHRLRRTLAALDRESAES